MPPSRHLIARLQAADGADRRLDAELVAAVAGPQDCALSAHGSDEGWAIEAPEATGGGGGVSCWMEAGEVPPLTASLDELHVFLAQMRPQDGSVIMARGLITLVPRPWETPASFAGRLARAVLAELLRTLDEEARAQASTAA